MSGSVYQLIVKLVWILIQVGNAVIRKYLLLEAKLRLHRIDLATLLSLYPEK